MPEPRKPQDHKPKKSEPDEFFSFTGHDGTEYTMPNRTVDVITTKFVRLNRRRDETDYAFTCLEALAEGDESIMDAIDGLSRAELNKLIESFNRHAGASLGE